MRFQFVTDSSVWIIDPDAKMLTRMPKSEDPTHLELPYERVGAPQGYDRFSVLKRGDVRQLWFQWDHEDGTTGGCTSGYIRDGDPEALIAYIGDDEDQ